ncbi:MAG: outer membrane protein assembly factor [Spirochaetia bacterium]|nr:outer membrane protein assembly factor [Spirochaetia bacterium]
MKHIKLIVKIAVILFNIIYVLNINSQENKETSETNDINNKTQDKIPDGFENKPALSEEQLRKKKEDWYIIPLPLYSADVDKGFGLGLRLIYYDNGLKSDPYFKYTAYRHRAYVQYFHTTNGWQYHTINYDSPFFLNSIFSLKTSLVFEKNIASTYFGVGEETLDKLKEPYTGDIFESYKNYKKTLREIHPDGKTYSKYNQYINQTPAALMNFESDIYKGILGFYGGIKVSHVKITDYSGTDVDAYDAEGNEIKSIMGDTQLKKDCDAGIIIGCNGGWNNTIKLGISYDTRDFEPDPNNGVYIDTVIEKSINDYNFTRHTSAARIYYSPFNKALDLVIAARASLVMNYGNTPFYEMNKFNFTSGDKKGLGGYATFRGYTQDRFIGKIQTLINLETRWTMFDFDIWGQNYALILVPFFDTGRVYDNIKSMTFQKWKYGGGMGFRLAWNQALVSFFDIGWSKEGVSYSMNLDHIF